MYQSSFARKTRSRKRIISISRLTLPFQFFRAASLPGHEDWVKCLAFQHDIAGPSVLTLASGSQDSTIRLWNIERLVKEKTTSTGQEGGGLSDELLDSFEASLGDLAEGEEGGRQISMKRHIVTVGSKDGGFVAAGDAHTS